MVGPDFHTPKEPALKRYTSSPLPKKTVGTSGLDGKPQRFLTSKTIPREWWKLFHSKELNQLIQVGIANSPNIASARASLLEAKENLYAEIGSGLFPTISASLGGERQRASNASIGVSDTNIFNLFNASVTVTYTPDVFGGIRRQIESLQAQVDNQRYELIATYLSLTANITTTAITIASLQDQINATNELIKMEKQYLNIVKQQYRLGGVSEASVLSQESTLAQTQATLPPLQQSLSQNRHALAVLVGAFPSNMPHPKLTLNQLTLPANIPVTLPSSLVRQRPDVLAAEATLASASAQIGVATANLFPQFTLGATYGWTGLVFSTLFNPNNKVWDYSGEVTQTVFAGGSLFAKRRAAIDAYNQSLAQYQQTVLQAFQNVADSLRAVQHDAETLRAQKRATVAAYQSMILTKDQFQLGGVDYLSLLTAQQQYQQARLSLVQAQAARLSDTAALFQALGGGWWNTDGIDKQRCKKTCVRNATHEKPL